MNKTPLSLTDDLAIDRTKLANERTFLAYFRTFIVLLSSGFAIIKLKLLSQIQWMGHILIIAAPLLLLIGYIRFVYAKKSIKNIMLKNRDYP